MTILKRSTLLFLLFLLPFCVQAQEEWYEGATHNGVFHSEEWHRDSASKAEAERMFRVDSLQATFDKMVPAQKIDFLIEVGDILFQKGRYQAAEEAYQNAKDIEPMPLRYCDIKHRMLRAIKGTGEGSDNFARSVLYDKECEPWTSEERCMAMELYIKNFMNAWQYEPMQKYADSVRILCGHEPYIKGYAEMVKQIPPPPKPPETYKEWMSDAYDKRNSKDYQGAIESYKKARNFTNIYEEKYLTYNYTTGVLIDQGLSDSAIAYLRHLPSLISLNQHDKCATIQYIGEIYYDEMKYQKSITELLKALSLSTSPMQRSNISKELSDAYYKIGDRINGLKYYKMAQ